MEKEIRFHPALPLKEQIENISVKMISDLISAFPYQAFVVKDSLKKRAVYKKGQELLVEVFVGRKNQSQQGDRVQFIDWTQRSNKALFLGGHHIEVFAEGEILEKQEDRVQVKLLKYVDIKEIEEGTPVRIPKEHQRLRETMGLEGQISIIRRL